jgi:hypothetical protein
MEEAIWLSSMMRLKLKSHTCSNSAGSPPLGGGGLPASQWEGLVLDCLQVLKNLAVLVVKTAATRWPLVLMTAANAMRAWLPRPGWWGPANGAAGITGLP